ncbi:MAG: hypothetical protein AMJ81_06275 [Phycisphaerae bacterium SM23_33]|nr:MAG: hypothetical protein AMJ81_06275 [Phycisphaerae bacterium SM23_33]
MLRFAVLGLGFMGRTHLATLAARPQAEIRAVHDSDPQRLTRPLAPGGGNIETGAAGWDESAVRRCQTLEEILNDEDIDAVVVATPSHLHARLSCAALAAGKHVFCEKPMALKLADCDRMLAAAGKAGRTLMIGHCIRFWGEYAAAAEIVRSGRFGRLQLLTMSRRCGVPTFGARGWFTDHKKSGGALLDLHIHDVDYALYLLGPPRSVRARGLRGPSGGYDQVLSWYDYGRAGPVVQLEGGWSAGEDIPFVMSFRMCLERATLVYAMDKRPTLWLYSDSAEELQAPAVSGYEAEMDHFIRCIRSGKPSRVVPPESSRQSVALALAEAQAIRSGRAVEIH